MGLTEATYFGYTVGGEVIKPQINRVEAIKNWPRQINKNQVRAFMEIVSYYKRFIPHFASRTAPLIELTKAREIW